MTQREASEAVVSGFGCCPAGKALVLTIVSREGYSVSRHLRCTNGGGRTSRSSCGRGYRVFCNAQNA